jgi:hypothetical protein
MAFENAGTIKEGDELPKPFNDLLTATFQGRKDQREAQQKNVAESQSAAAVIKHTSSSSNKRETTPIKTFEAHLKEREAMMNWLHQLIEFPGMPVGRVTKFKTELM